MFPETSRLSTCSSEYSQYWPKADHQNNGAGATVVKAHSGRTLLRHWVHIAAIAVTAGLAAINVLNIYLMDSNRPDTVAMLNAFQFAAKLHEILIVGSLMLIMMDTVRGMLIKATGVPFGCLLAPVLFNDLEWLISHQFWSSIRPTWSSLPLTVLVLTAIPFANLAGPLSAITVVPRLGWSAPQAAAIFPTFWNSSASKIWPETLAASDLIPACFTGEGQRDGCPGGAFSTINVLYDPKIVGSIHCITIASHVACNATLYPTQFRELSLEYDVDSLTTFSSTPTEVIFETLANRFATGMAFPLNITETETVDAQKTQLIGTRFIGNRQLLKPVSRTMCEDLSYSEIYQTLQDFKVEANWTAPFVHWLGNIDDSLTPSFLFTYLKNDTRLDAARGCDGLDCYAAVRCTTNAKWVPMSIWHNSAHSTVTYQSDPQPQQLFESEASTKAPSVIIQKDWLEAMSVPRILDTSDTFNKFMNHWMVPMAGPPRIGSDQGTQSRPKPSNYSQAISILVSSIITEGLSQASLRVGDSIYKGNCSDRKPGFQFASKICDQSPSKWVHAESLGSLQEDFSMMTFTVQRNGYGWFIDSLTVRIALGILLFHGVLTLVYLVFSLAFRRTITTCWSSAPEMLMLAIDSLRAPILMGSSAKATNRLL